MNRVKRQARAKARAKSMRIRRRGVVHQASKWGYMSDWKGDGLTPGEVQSARKTARRDGVSP
jgi:hypothetical protein